MNISKDAKIADFLRAAVKKEAVSAKVIHITSLGEELGSLVYYTVKTLDNYYAAMIKLVYGDYNFEVYNKGGFQTEDEAQKIIDRLYEDTKLVRE